jgi:SAM-dependent methyltransferase
VTAYDDFAYPSVPLQQTQPDNLVTQLALHGARAPDPGSCRVLELGCSDAGNLAWLAGYSPESTMLGLDLSAEAVARAQSIIEGLPNIAVRCADLTTLDEGDFDIVIAHGVYSWLPDPADLLACIDRHLAPDGVAFVSYNTLPGCHVRRMAGDPLRRFTDGDPERLSEGRALLEWLASSTAAAPHAQMMRTAANLALGKPDHLLVHDEMAADNHAVYFDDFITDAAVHNLAYLGEAHLADSQPPEGVELPAWLPEDEVPRQQLLDYARNRAFRQTLLVRPQNAPLSYVVDPSVLQRMWAGAPVKRTREGYVLANGVELTTSGEDVHADLDRLAQAWPRFVPVADLATDDEVLLRMVVARGLELSTRPSAAVMPGDRPRVIDYARRRASIDGAVASTRHTRLILDDPISRQIVAHCDGQTTREDLMRMVVRMPSSPSNPQRDLDALLDGLGRAGLMVG